MSTCRFVQAAITMVSVSIVLAAFCMYSWWPEYEETSNHVVKTARAMQPCCMEANLHPSCIVMIGHTYVNVYSVNRTTSSFWAVVHYTHVSRDFSIYVSLIMFAVGLFVGTCFWSIISLSEWTSNKNLPVPVVHTRSHAGNATGSLPSTTGGTGRPLSMWQQATRMAARPSPPTVPAPHVSSAMAQAPGPVVYSAPVQQSVPIQVVAAAAEAADRLRVRRSSRSRGRSSERR